MGVGFVSADAGRRLACYGFASYGLASYDWMLGILWIGLLWLACLASYGLASYALDRLASYGLASYGCLASYGLASCGCLASSGLASYGCSASYGLASYGCLASNGLALLCFAFALRLLRFAFALPLLSSLRIRTTAGFSTPGGCLRGMTTAWLRQPQPATLLLSTPPQPLATHLSNRPTLAWRLQTHPCGFASSAPRLCADRRQ